MLFIGGGLSAEATNHPIWHWYLGHLSFSIRHFTVWLALAVVGEHSFHAWYRKTSRNSLVETIDHYKASPNRQAINEAVDKLFTTFEPPPSNGGLDTTSPSEQQIVRLVLDNRLCMSIWP